MRREWGNEGRKMEKKEKRASQLLKALRVHMGNAYPNQKNEQKKNICCSIDARKFRHQRE